MKKIIFLFFVFAIFTIACSKMGDKSAILNSQLAKVEESFSNFEEEAKITETDGAEDTETFSEKGTDILTQVKNPDKIIKTASIEIEVENYEQSLNQIKQFIKKNDAYVSEENEFNYSTYINNTIKIRVPKDNFDQLVNSITEIAEKVTSRTVNILDVTEEYIDIQTRLKTKKELENRYIELLKKANTIREILSIEEQICKIREEIESKEGRLKYLNDKIGYSSIELNIYQYFDDIYKPGFIKNAFKALEGGWIGIKVFVLGILYLWPLFVVLVLVFVIIRRYRKKRKAKKLEK